MVSAKGAATGLLALGVGRDTYSVPSVAALQAAVEREHCQEGQPPTARRYMLTTYRRPGKSVVQAGLCKHSSLLAAKRIGCRSRRRRGLYRVVFERVIAASARCCCRRTERISSRCSGTGIRRSEWIISVGCWRSRRRCGCRCAKRVAVLPRRHLWLITTRRGPNCRHVAPRTTAGRHGPLGSSPTNRQSVHRAFRGAARGVHSDGTSQCAKEAAGCAAGLG